MRVLSLVTAACLVVTFAGCDERSGEPPAGPSDPDVGVARAGARPEIHPERSPTPRPASSDLTAAEANGLHLVATLDLGVSSDVWAHRSIAYVAGFLETFDGTTSVKAVDISNPSNPVLIAELPGPPGASQQDVKVVSVATAGFVGDLAIIGMDGFTGGVQLWDVTAPASPVLLGTLPFAFVHNVYPFQQHGRWYVAMAVPFEESFGVSGLGDVIIADITDPTSPTIVGDWGAGKNAGLPNGFLCDPSVCRGSVPAAFGHDVWVGDRGRTAYVAYWDLGLIILDVSDPANPALIGRGVAPPTFGNDDGDLHVAVPARGGEVVLTGDEDISPVIDGSLPWGFLRVFDARNPSAPVQVSAYATEGALNDPSFVDPFERTMHNVVVDGHRAFISWYGEGIRVVDISRPAQPEEIASWDPGAPGVVNFWGVYQHRDVVLASDFFSGLYVFALQR